MVSFSLAAELSKGWVCSQHKVYQPWKAIHQPGTALHLLVELSGSGCTILNQKVSELCF